MSKTMIALMLLVLLIFGGVFGAKYVGGKMMQDAIANMPIPPVTITAGSPQTMSWERRLEAVGSLVAVQGTTLTTESGGLVSAIHFESGQMVAKGDRLISLDGANERGELARLQAQAELAELNRQRREKLLKLEAVSKSDYDAVAAEARAAKAAVEAARARLAQKEIVAPFAGRLGIRQVNLGQYLAPGAPIVSLQMRDPIDVDFSLPEQHLGRVEPGFPVQLVVDAHGDRRFDGQVLAVEPVVDPATRNFTVRARLPNPDGLLSGGQFARVTLLLPGAESVLAVPRTAIDYSSYGASVYVVQPRSGATAGELEVIQRFVRLGEARGDFVAVAEGLKPDERVATSGLLKLRNQQPVSIDNSNPPQPSLSPSLPNT